MKTVHMTLAPKGGIGKSLIANLLTQWLMERDRNVVAFDNDPATATLQTFPGLPVRKLDLLTGGVINKKAYDTMFMAMTTEDATFVVDNGASNFIELMHYMTTSRLLELLAGLDLKPVLHVPLIGGEGTGLTVGGLDNIAENLSGPADIVVWLNLRDGPIIGDGKPWQEMRVYKRIASRLHSEITLPAQDQMTRDAFAKMMTQGMTFAEVMASASDDFDLFDKSRLTNFKNDVFQQLDQLIGAGPMDDAKGKKPASEAA
jgi:hypothetical protein